MQFLLFPASQCAPRLRRKHWKRLPYLMAWLSYFKTRPYQPYIGQCQVLRDRGLFPSSARTATHTIRFGNVFIMVTAPWWHACHGATINTPSGIWKADRCSNLFQGYRYNLFIYFIFINLAMISFPVASGNTAYLNIVVFNPLYVQFNKNKSLNRHTLILLTL